MKTQNLVLRKSLLALVIGSLTVSLPVYAQQQTEIESPQLEEGNPAPEQADNAELVDLSAPDTEGADEQTEAPQAGEVGEDTAVSEAAVDLNVDPMVGNRPDERTGERNTLRFGGESAERPAGAIVTEPTSDAVNEETANTPNAVPPADGSTVTQPGAPNQTQNPTDEAESEAPAVADEASPDEPAATATARRMEGVYPLAIEELTDRHVVNSAGQMLGEVEVAVVNEASGEAGLVVSVGNLTGISSAQALAPADQLHLSGDVLIWQTPHSADQITEVRAYNAVDYREIVGSYDSLDEASRELSEPED